MTKKLSDLSRLCGQYVYTFQYLDKNGNSYRGQSPIQYSDKSIAGMINHATSSFNAAEKSFPDIVSLVVELKHQQNRITFKVEDL